MSVTWFCSQGWGAAPPCCPGRGAYIHVSGKGCGDTRQARVAAHEDGGQGTSSHQSCWLMGREGPPVPQHLQSTLRVTE